jgi:hypothetical protein
MITLDNASVCAKLMESLEGFLRNDGISFNRNANRIQCVIILGCYVYTNMLFSCFPHVVNIAVQAALVTLTEEPYGSQSDEERYNDMLRLGKDPESFSNMSDNTFTPQGLRNDWLEGSHTTDEIYRAVLESDVVTSARNLASALRASSARKERLEAIINDGNNNNIFNPPLAALHVLKDMKVRWSSTLIMIDRILELYLVRSCIYS